MKIRSLTFIALIAVGCADSAPESNVPKYSDIPDLYGDPLPVNAVGRLGTIRFLPESSALTNIKYSPDGKLIATLSTVIVGSTVPGLQIWDPKTGHSVGLTELKYDYIRAFAWSPDSRQIAVCNDFGVIEVWDVHQNKPVRTFSNEEQSSTGLAWSSDGKWIATGRDSGAIDILDSVTGKVFKAFNHGATCLEFSHDSNQLAAVSEGHVKIWDIYSGVLRCNQMLETEHNYSIAFAPDDKMLAVSGDKTSIIDISDTIPRVSLLPENISSFTVDFSPDGRKLATSSPSGVTQVWNLDGLTEIRRYSGQTGFSVAFCPKGNEIVLNRRRLSFANFKTGIESADYNGHDHVGLGVLVSSDGKTAYTHSVGPTIRQWKIGSTREMRKLRLPTDSVGGARAIALSRNGDTLVVAQKKSIHIFDTGSGHITETLEGHADLITHVSVSPTTDLLVSRSSDGNVRFWDLVEFRLLGSLDLGLVKCFSGYSTFSPDGRQLALVSPLHAEIELVDPRTRRGSRRIEVDESMDSVFLPLCFSPDSKSIVLLDSSPDSEAPSGIRYHVKLTNSDSAKTIRRLNGEFNYPAAIAYSPRGDLIAIADTVEHEGVDPRSQIIHIFASATGQLLVQFKGHVDRIRQVAFTPDGNKLLSASQDSTILVWSLAAAIDKLPAN